MICLLYTSDNFEQYETYSRKIEKILQNSKPKKDDEPIFMIRDITERQFKRQAELPKREMACHNWFLACFLYSESFER